MTRPAAALALLALLLTGCSGAAAGPSGRASGAGAAAPVATQAASPSPTPSPDCPAGRKGERWPQGVPADLPVPPTAKIATTDVRPDGLTLVRFSTTQSIRQGIVFLVGALQPAGYAIGRGDAEAVEADVPFTKGPLRGLMKMIAQGDCTTQWVLALQKQAGVTPGAPLLPRAASASPSSLPFG